MTEVSIRRATRDDLQAIVEMLADDELGRQRESPDDLGIYEGAFDAIARDPNHYLSVCVSGRDVVGTMQLTCIPGLSHRGMSRLLIEGVRVHRDARGRSIGSHMMAWAIDHARERGCGMVQLTTDMSRSDAHRFYERLGFQRTHFGYKMKL